MKVRRSIAARRAVWCAAVLAVCPAAMADTASWVNPVSGNWTDATKWSTNPAYPNNGSPTPKYDVIVNAVGGPYTITLSSHITIDSFKLDSAGATLQGNVTGLIQSPGTFEIASGSVVQNGTGLWVGSIIGGSNALLQVVRTSSIDTATIGVNVDIQNSTVLSMLHATVNLDDARISYSGGSGTTSRIKFIGAAPKIGGVGEIVFDSAGDNFFQGDGAVLDIGAGITVRTGSGSGFVGGESAPEGFVNHGIIAVETAGQSLQLMQHWTNQGVLKLSDCTLKLRGTFTPADIGTVQRSGGTLQIAGMLNNAGTTFSVDNSIGSVGLNIGGTIAGGTVTSSSGNRLTVDDFGILDGVTLALDAPFAVNGVLQFLDTVTLAGNQQINLVTATAPATNSRLSLSTTGPLLGTGAITFDSPTQTGRVIGSTMGVATVGPGITIQTGLGSGEFNGSISGVVNQGLIWAKTAGKSIQMLGPWTNEGMLRVSAGDLILGGTWKNNGSITASGGTLNLSGVSSGLGSISVSNAKLSISSNFTSAQIKSIGLSGAQVSVIGGGVVDNTGDTIDFDAATASWGVGGGSIKNGTINSTDGSTFVASSGSSVLENVLLNTDASISNGATLTLLNPPDSTGKRITLSNSNSLTSLALTVPAAQKALNGSGEIIFDGNANNVVRTSSGTLTVGPQYVVRTGSGGGTLGSSGGATVNQGWIVAQRRERR